MVDQVEKPIEVTNSTLPEQLFALMRQLTLIIGGFATLLTLLKAKDVAGIVEFLRSSEFLPALAGALTLAALIYGNLKMKWRKRELIVAAKAAPDHVAKLVGPDE